MTQHILYPVALGTFTWLLTRTKFHHLAKYVPLLVLPWLFGVALKSGYLSWLRTKPAVYFISASPLSGGSGEFSSYRRFQELSRFFRFPSVSFIEREFFDIENLRSWQKTLPAGSVAVNIRDDGFEVSLPLYPKSAVENNSEVGDLIRAYKLHSDGGQFIVVPRELSGSELFLSLPSRIVTISAKSSEQSLHFIGWLAKLSSSWVWNTPIDEYNRTAAIAELQRLEDSAAQLHMLSGWNNNVAKLICRLVQGNVMFLEALIQGGENRPLLERAAKRYRSAFKLLRNEEVPELESALRNNYGLTSFLLAETPKDLNKAQKELLRAASIGQKPTIVPVGSRLALINLAQLPL